MEANKMRKIYTILVMALLVLSMLPAAFAQQAANQEPAGNSAGTANDSEVQESVQIRTRLRVLQNESAQVKEQIRERIRNISESNLSVQERLQFRREIAKEQIQLARQRYQTAKQSYLNARQRYQTAKSNIEKARNTINRCRDAESEECTQAANQMKLHSKNFLESTADRVLNILEQLKAKVEANEDLTEEEASEMLSNIDEQIQKIEEAKDTIENLDNESTKEDIREAANTIKEAWRETKVIAKQRAGRIVNAKVGGIIVQIEHVKEKLDRIIERLKNEGYEIEGIEQIYADFEVELEKAGENYEKARELYQSAAAPGEIDEVMKQANDYMRKAKQHIQNAHKMLRNLVINIKGLQNGQRLLETSDEETEE
jgi:hypothetical protein